MPSRESVARLRREIAARFPSEAAAIDGQMLDYGDDAYEVWIERFCDLTNEAMARLDEPTVQAHLSFVSHLLATTDKDGQRAIDVSYAENMMCNLDPDVKRWAWPQVPENLKQLYVDMWGGPRF